MSISWGKPFASLLRNSEFIKLGDIRNAVVVGKIFHTVGDDLYVDLGLKFHTVVKRPQTNPKLYVRGSKVRMKLLSYEITDRFIGEDGPRTLLEADAILLGLESTPVGTGKRT